MIDHLIKNIERFLAKPFFMWEHTVTRKFWVIFIFISTSIAFIYTFEPSVFSILPQEERALHFLSHSLVAILTFLIFYFIVPLGFRGYFEEKKRTIGRQIIFVTSLILTASEGNRIVALVLKETADFTFISSVGFTLGISLFPFLIWIGLSIYQMTTQNPVNRLIDLFATIGKDKIRIFFKDLLYVKSFSNYSEIYFLDKNEIKMRMLRIPLSALNEQLNSEYCIRCHRSYIVNLYNVSKIEGNVNTSKIHLRDSNYLIPVSKSRREKVINKLNALPIPHIS